MTTVMLLLLGFGSILIVSAFETDPATGQSPSLIQTVKDVWNGNVSFGGQEAGQRVTEDIRSGHGTLGDGPLQNTTPQQTPEQIARKYRQAGSSGIGEGELAIHELNARLRQNGLEPVDPRVLRYWQRVSGVTRLGG